MPKTTGLSLEELKAKRKELMSQGKELSTSKDLGKIEQAIKVANPGGYSADQVNSASANLKLINEPTVSGVGGTTTTGATPTTTSDISLLEKQLSDKQAALTKATGNVNDNPWYSEATRTGKLAKLNNIAQLEIGNIQNAITQKKQDTQNAFNNNLATQKLALDVQTANKPAKGTTPKEVVAKGADVASTLPLLEKYDNIVGGNNTPDNLLSTDEIAQMKAELLKTYGDTDYVDQLVFQAMNTYHYNIWRG